MRTKIVCTIGPASENKNILKSMIKAGMDVARLTFAHGNYRSHATIIRNVRNLSKELDKPIAIIQDIQGPKIRVGKLPDKGIDLGRGDKVILTTSNIKYQKSKIEKIPVQYKNLHKEVKKGNTILLDDGLITLKILRIKGRDIECKVLDGGVLTSNKGLNVPTASINISPITEKDKKDVEFGIKNDVDFIAMSFVKTEGDILNLRKLIKKYEKKYKKSNTKVIAKIEKHEAIKNFDRILKEADGIMVARGDLGLETPIEKVPILQKMIISKCLESKKPVIVATQMLNSMIKEPRPTRAEVSDVANAVIDHADAVMLSGESASGKYPVESVKMMSRIIDNTEESPYDNLIIRDDSKKIKDKDIVLAYAAYNMVRNAEVKLILIVENSGRLSLFISRYRPEIPIVVVLKSEKIQRQLALCWGIIPIVLNKYRKQDELIKNAVKFVVKNGLVRRKDKIVVMNKRRVEVVNI